MASKKRSHFEYWNGSSSTFIDEDRYRKTVLQLDSREAEELVETQLFEAACQLRLLPQDIQYPFLPFSFDTSPDRHSNNTNHARTAIQTPPPTPTKAMSVSSSSVSVQRLSFTVPNTPTFARRTSTAASSSVSTLISSKDRILPSSSRHSIISSSTCPTFCSCNMGRRDSSILSSSSSIPDKGIRTRHSLDQGHIPAAGIVKQRRHRQHQEHPDSRDGKLKFGFRHAFSRLQVSSFKKRPPGDFAATAATRSALTLPPPPPPQPSLPHPQRAATGPESPHPGDPTDTTEFPVNHSSRDISTQEWIDSLRSLLPDNLSSESNNEESVTRSLASPQLCDLRSIQVVQRDAHVALRKELVNHLSASHEELLEARTSENRKLEQDIADKHAERAARLEENQLSAELSLLDEFKREKLALQSCIRHMEAYFRTPSIEHSNASDNNNTDSDSSSFATDPTSQLCQPRQYTQEERDRLRQKYHERDTIDTLHESKIKVLRGRQAKQSEESTRKMERERADLTSRNERLSQDLERQCQRETKATVAWLEGREKRLVTRWFLEEAILRKRMELETKLVYAPLPALSFEEPESPARV